MDCSRWAQRPVWWSRAVLLDLWAPQACGPSSQQLLGVAAGAAALLHMRWRCAPQRRALCPPSPPPLPPCCPRTPLTLLPLAPLMLTLTLPLLLLLRLRLLPHPPRAPAPQLCSLLSTLRWSRAALLPQPALLLLQVAGGTLCPQLQPPSPLSSLPGQPGPPPRQQPPSAQWQLHALCSVQPTGSRQWQLPCLPPPQPPLLLVLVLVLLLPPLQTPQSPEAAGRHPLPPVPPPRAAPRQLLPPAAGLLSWLQLQPCSLSPRLSWRPRQLPALSSSSCSIRSWWGRSSS